MPALATVTDLSGQTITPQVTAANQAGLSDALMAASNSSGGVLGWASSR